ncbi:hypothetical protein MHTCC0001_04580 [Flavobacteriaceae bacterium MHTCC 0001]
MPFRFFKPENNNSSNNKKYPLVLVMHGSSESGTDNERHIAKDYVKNWASNKVQLKHPCYVLAPQVHFNTWINEETNEIVNATLDSLIAVDNIDENRIYLTGHSMGGFGSWFFPYYTSGKIAAAVPVSGFWLKPEWSNTTLQELTENYPNTSIWNFHHRRDGDQGIEESRKIVKEFEKHGINFVKTNPYTGTTPRLTDVEINELINNGTTKFYTEYDFPCEIGVIDCHQVADRIIEDTLLIKWLFKQNKKDNLKTDLFNDIDFIMHPNPVNSIINIKSSITTEGFYTIYSINGKVVMKGKFNTKNPIYLNNLHKEGVFLIKFNTNNKDYLKKIIIKK